ncbi:MAG: DUF427 domain-containing protein [Spirochaetales bacterium]|nr:DUF427 domain-containing protein [Spirochaetales bacterium]
MIEKVRLLVQIVLCCCYEFCVLVVCKVHDSYTQTYNKAYNNDQINLTVYWRNLFHIETIIEHTDTAVSKKYGEKKPEAAWFYPHPKEAARNIKGYIAFWKGVAVEK